MSIIKHILFLLSVSFLPFCLTAQSKSDTLYYTSVWNQTTNLDSIAFYGFKEYDTSEIALASYFYQSGELYSQQKLKNNLKDGYCVWFYKNGKVSSEGKYMFDYPYGPHQWYNIKGELDSTKYVNGYEPEVSSDSIGHVYTFVDKDAEFPGGFSAMMQFISQNFIYPFEAAENGIQGSVYIKFVIEKDGSVSNVKIEKGLSPSVDAEASRIVQSMPSWKPAMKNGKMVSAYYKIPIKLELEGRRRRKN